MGIGRIQITGARRHNLSGVDLTLPRRAVTAFTGVSGSGKSSLVFGTIAAEAQRQLSELFPAFARGRLPGYGRPEVDRVQNLSPVVVIDQRRLAGNARSTVGTITDIHPLLRLLFSRAGEPSVGESPRFSFNDPAGMCPGCSGLGRVVAPAPETFLDLDRSLRGGAILLPGFGDGQYWYRQYADIGLFDPDAPLRQWTSEQRAALLHGGEAAARLGTRPPREYEGLLERFNRVYLHTDGEMSRRKQAVVERFTTSEHCGECGGGRLNAQARSVRVEGRSIVECTAMEVGALTRFLAGLGAAAGVEPVVESLVERLRALEGIGLGYLTLDRPTTTLSGGESQRIKAVRHLGGSLTEMIYVFDEPTVGLHPEDCGRLIALLRRLRDKGNTILVVEHDPAIVAVADHVVDVGPGAGAGGGQVVYQGSPQGLVGAATPTGRALAAPPLLRTEPRSPTGRLALSGISRNNLRGLDVAVPTGVLTAVTGVAGSGKSSLVAELVARHPEATLIDQGALATHRRSSLMTYLGAAEAVRRAFARANGVAPALFSPNSAGACRQCRGLGGVHTDLAFMEGVTTPCRACEGRRFSAEVLAHTWKGRTIAEVLDLSAAEALEKIDLPRVRPALRALVEVGLGHLALGRGLDTLSGGECQRVKLAMHMRERSAAALYILDEPTTGLHRTDVGRLLAILDGLVEAGGTVVVVEHDLDVVARADWVIDLGPGAGRRGGRVLFSGPPVRLAGEEGSATARHLRRRLSV